MKDKPVLIKGKEYIEAGYFVQLKQKHWLLQCPVLKRMFIKTYCPQGMVQYDDDHNLTYCGSIVRWLDKFHIEAMSEKAADKLAFEYLLEKYPMYGKYLSLF